MNFLRWRLIFSASVAAFLILAACSNPPSLDERTSSLVATLGPLCKNFDFQHVQDVGVGQFRPVWCSEVGPNDEHPQFTLFVFSGPEVQEQWLQLPGAMGGRYHVNGNGWSAMSDEDILDEVKDRLGG